MLIAQSLKPFAFSFYLLALLSKEMAITFPLILFLYQLISPLPSILSLSKDGERDRVRGKELGSILFNPYNIGYILITLFYLYLRFFLFHNPVEENISAWSFSERLMTIPYLILKYLLLLIAHVSLSADYVITPINSVISLKFIIPVIVIMFIIMLPLIFNLQSSIFNRQSAFGILFLLLTLLPVYNVIPIANPFAERYLYLPSVGFVIIIFSIIQSVNIKQEGKKFYIPISMIIIISIYSLAVVNRNVIWRDELSLWSDVVSKSPDKASGHNNLGNDYRNQGQLDEAIKEYLIAIRIKPDFAGAYNNLGVAYAKQGRLSEAIQEYQASLRINPNDAGVHNNLGVAYDMQGRINEAIDEYQVAIRINPDYVEAYYNLGNAYVKQGRIDEARKEFETVLRLKPDDFDSHTNLGSIYISQGRQVIQLPI
ncbi:MAG: tetratricopeptide repeat protein [Nitrospinae bacterium]|nr:tetratricopeptide repeat protein [Nitrospinota bacterium]